MVTNEYAFIKDGTVVNIAVFENPTTNLLNLFKKEYNVDLIIPSTSYNRMGHMYDGEDFYPQKPFPSWTKNKTLKNWEPPISYPTDGKIYTWNEQDQKWDEVING